MTDCHICCEVQKYSAKYTCGHEICHKCATRLLYLYGCKKCPMCKHEKDLPVFCTTDARRKGPLPPGNTPPENTPAGNTTPTIAPPPTTDGTASFSDNEVFQKVKSLLAIKCKECKWIFQSKRDLIGHFKAKHNAMLCASCLDNNHQFWYEYITYTPEALSQHRKGRLTEPGFFGHVFCPFCNIWQYSKETARLHCNKEHQLCTVCDSIGQRQQFYRNFSELEQHYRSKHFCCENSVCIKNYCYVYAYKSELCSHSMTHHGMELQLSDISVKSGVNPLVFSLQEHGGGGESPYRQGVNILTPLVSEPYFPPFRTGVVPGFLDRRIVEEETSVALQRERIIGEITTGFSKEISGEVEKYMAGMIELREMVGVIQECAGTGVTQKILFRVPFGKKQKEVGDFLVEYKKELKFPPFKKSERKESGTGKTSVGFKIIDLSKGR